MPFELENNDDELVDKLARALYQPEEAVEFALSFGFPQQHLPAFKKANEFWGAIVRDIEAGILENGKEALKEAARRRFPGDRFFNPPTPEEDPQETEDQPEHNPRTAAAAIAATLVSAITIAIITSHSNITSKTSGPTADTPPNSKKDKANSHIAPTATKPFPLSPTSTGPADAAIIAPKSNPTPETETITEPNTASKFSRPDKQYTCTFTRHGGIEITKSEHGDKTTMTSLCSQLVTNCCANQQMDITICRARITTGNNTIWTKERPCTDH